MYRVAPLLVSVVAVVGGQTAALAKQVVRCTAPGGPDVVMTLDGQRMLKRTVSCIQGDFIADMTPCAPNGGFGLSAPTGTAALVQIAGRWQDYAGHLGGVASYSASASSLTFTGGFFNGQDSWTGRWSFSADRLSGAAVLKVDGRPDVAYACARTRPRF